MPIFLDSGSLGAPRGISFEENDMSNIYGYARVSTGEQIKKDADKVVKMTIAKALKDSVNG